MAAISNITGHRAEGANHSRIAHDYIAKWQTLGINHNANPPHTTLSYGSPNSHGKSSYSIS